MKRYSKAALATILAVSLGAKVFAGTGVTGEFQGSRENAYYGYVQVTAVVENGKLKTVKIVESPFHAGRSKYISSVALPWLVTEAVQSQSARVDLVTGATLTSEAFARSLDEALKKAGI